MSLKSVLAALACTASAVALIASGTAGPAHAQTPAAVAIDTDDIGGVVRGPGGPEAGVWVIAETRDLPVRFIRIVVTDEQGRYVIPDLPKASYDVWVRGYGLVDSPKVKSEPGKQLNLTAVAAASEAEAAQYYPAAYWYAMMEIPSADQFGPGNKSGLPANVKLTDYLNTMKNNGCVGCHQLGHKSTRTIPEMFLKETGGKHEDAWMRRIQSGQSGEQMINLLAGGMGGVPFKYLGAWTQRVANGELPPAKPTRPQGKERNIVVTLRDWHNPKQYLHDLIASDRRYPTVNAYGPLYGQCEHACNDMPILDPVKNVASNFVLPTTADMPYALGPGNAGALKILQPSAYWGEENIWDSKANNHNSMFDRKGRVWLAATGHTNQNPDWCKKGSDHPSAKLHPLDATNRRVTMYDPKTGKYTPYLTCFGSHHLQFGYDPNETVWMSGGNQVLGWINTKMLDETGDIQKSQGWTSFVLDTNGNGKRDEHTEPGQPADAAKDRRISMSFYAVMPSPVDGSIWGTHRANPGAILRVAPGSNPPHTALTEVYNVPLPGFGPRGGDIDKQGRVVVSLASGHMGIFDRRKCKGPLNGPTATGDHCPEGWSFHQYPGPGFKGLGENSVESSYYSWVDQHNVFGMGDDIPMSTANLMDGLVAMDKDGTMVSIRVPYPLGFYAKGFDGRIDDPNAGWKGRGLWAANGDRTPWLIEGGKGTKPLAAHFQYRPDPLAK